MRSISGNSGPVKGGQAGPRAGPAAAGTSGGGGGAPPPAGPGPAAPRPHTRRPAAPIPAAAAAAHLNPSDRRHGPAPLLAAAASLGWDAPSSAAAAAAGSSDGSGETTGRTAAAAGALSVAQQLEELASRSAVKSFPVEPSDASSDEDIPPPAIAAAAAAAGAAAATSSPPAAHPRTAARRRRPQSGAAAASAAAAPAPKRQQRAAANGARAPVNTAAAAAAAATAIDVGGSWRALRSMAVLALICGGPLALLARNPGLASNLANAFKRNPATAAPESAAAAAAAAASFAPGAMQAAIIAAATTAAAGTTNPGSRPSPHGIGIASSSGNGITGGGASPPRTTPVPRATGGGGGGDGGGRGGGSPEQAPSGPLIEMVAVAGPGASPLKGAPWPEVLRHMADRLRWTDPRFRLEVIDAAELEDPARRQALRARLSVRPPAVFAAAGIPPASPAATFLADATAGLRTALFWDCSPQLTAQQRVDGYAPAAAGAVAKVLAERVGWSREARAARVLGTLSELWGRHSSDDLLFTWLVVLNEYVTTVPAVANTTKGSDLGSIFCMVRYCLTEIVACVRDATCKAGLDCLQACSFNDQVCQYRCIVSHETKEFGDFSLCILNKHNCRGLSAEPPKIPDPAPMATFRGAPLTFESALAIKHGWLAGAAGGGGGGGAVAGGQQRAWSWLVAAGKNPAYDYFPCQHQLYYTKGSASWYEPVFKVITLQGPAVWRRRKYRVRAGKTPGTFYYSVLDNGVTSDEYWRILDAADDLSFALFFYTGAASRAGMSYSGAVLGTPDGAWPEQHAARIERALDRAGIKVWELSRVDNSACGGAPLGLA